MVKGYVYGGENFKGYKTSDIQVGKTRRYVKLIRLALLISFVMLFLVGAIHTVSVAATGAIHWVKETHESNVKKAIASYDTETVVVGVGETAWDLQQALIPNEDVRALLSLASELNPGVKFGELQAGQMIVLFKEKTK